MLKAKSKQTTIVDYSTELRNAILESVHSIDRNFLSLARNLHDVFKIRKYMDWGFATYEDYVNTELQFSYRKAKHLTNVWEKVEELDLDHAKVEEIGWSKAAEIIKVMDKDNADEWLEKARESSFHALEDEVKDVKGRKSRAEGKPTKMVLNIDENIYGIMEDAIIEAKRIHDTDDNMIALSQICGEWLLIKSQTPVKATIDDYILFVNRSFGVNLVLGNPAPVKQEKKIEEPPPFKVEDDDDDDFVDVDGLLDD